MLFCSIQVSSPQVASWHCLSYNNWEYWPNNSLTFFGVQKWGSWTPRRGSTPLNSATVAWLGYRLVPGQASRIKDHDGEHSWIVQLNSFNVSLLCLFCCLPWTPAHGWQNSLSPWNFSLPKPRYTSQCVVLVTILLSGQQQDGPPYQNNDSFSLKLFWSSVSQTAVENHWLMLWYICRFRGWASQMRVSG